MIMCWWHHIVLQVSKKLKRMIYLQHLVMLSEQVVWNGDSSGPQDCIDQPICAPWQRTVIHPDWSRRNDVNPISISLTSKSIMCGWAPHICISRRFAVVDMDSMNDDVIHILYCNASSVGNMDFGSSTVNSLVAVHEQLLLQLNIHIFLENDPERLRLDDSMAQSAESRIDWVVIIRISNCVNLAILTSNGVFCQIRWHTQQASFCS